MSQQLGEAFQHYVEDGSAGSREQLQREIARLPGYDPSTPWWGRAASLAGQERHDEVVRLVSDQMWGALLCVDAHRMLSTSHAALGHEEDAARHGSWADLALQAILESGDGSVDDPWVVLNVVDEYAVLEHRGETAVDQRLRREGLRWRDVLTLPDGTDRWFELVAVQ